MSSSHRPRFELAGVGQVELVPISEDHPRPESSSEFDNWGVRDESSAPPGLQRWLVEIHPSTGTPFPAGDLSAHPVWYGPTIGSMAMNMGISIAPAYRGKGIGSAAQRMLAGELHRRGVLRVEASTDVGNLPEQRALALAGFQMEGVARMAQQRSDGQHDLQIWSHLALNKQLFTELTQQITPIIPS